MPLWRLLRTGRTRIYPPNPYIPARKSAGVALANLVRSGTVSAKNKSPTGLLSRERHTERLAIFCEKPYMTPESPADEAVANPVRSGTKQP